MALPTSLSQQIVYRYERKFVSTSLLHEEMATMIHLNPAGFHEIYASRNVNSLYLDTPDLLYYQRNLDGVSQRSKVRIRWYGDLLGYVEEPFLEIKTKSGLIGGKMRLPLAPIMIDGALDTHIIHEGLLNSDLPDYVRILVESLEVSLLCRYGRHYYLSADGKFRATLDQGLQFIPILASLNPWRDHPIDPTTRVLEVKYHPDEDTQVRDVVKFFPFRLRSFSKYVVGVGLTRY